MHTNLRYSRDHGFTLVETLVAITVLLLVIIGPMTVAQKGIQNAYYANDQVTAVFLAQEAIEAVREMRDNEALDSYEGFIAEPQIKRATWNSWVNALDGTCRNPEVGCAYNVVSDTLGPCSSDCAIYKSADERYSHTSSGGTLTPFTRKVYVTEFNSNSVQVTVDVSWNAKVFGNGPRNVILQTWIYDHYQRYGQ